MKFAYSNIAWSAHDDPAIFKLLHEKGITGIEIAPTKLWPDWQGATAAAAQAYRRKLQDHGFVIPALQAVLFNKPDARLFSTPGQAVFIQHLTLIAQLAQAFAAPVVVLGAPRQRDRGELSRQEAVSAAVPLFRKLAAIYADQGVCLCIEPNPRAYDCNFIINATEGAELVRQVDHPGFGLHLDAAAMFLEQESLEQLWPDIGPLVRHYHISEPYLGDFLTPQAPHLNNLLTLRKAGYQGWCSVEMREPEKPLALVGPWSVVTSEG